jgi:hypothetical protein
MTYIAYSYLALIVICCLILVWTVKGDRKTRTTMGRVLLQLRSKLNDRVLLGFAAALILVYIWGVVHNIVNNTGNLREDILRGFFWITWICYLWFSQEKNSKLTENGLYYMGAFYRWEDILAWKWSKYDKTIIIRIKAAKKQKAFTDIEFKINKSCYNKANDILLKYKGKSNLSFN